MLHVFQMDTGQMLTFDMTLLMDTVSRLQVEIAKTTGISVEKQILILSGGQSLKSDQKVITYGAGADTNPVFLFSKLAIESQEPPLIRSFGSHKDALIQLRERISDAMKMRPSFDTVTVRTKLAVHIRDSANKILAYCNNEFKEQHLQYQGWGAVVANLEEIAQALQRTGTKFNKTFQTFLPNREKHSLMLQTLCDSFELLGRIPLLDSLKETDAVQHESDTKASIREKSVIASFHITPSTLFEWISSQAQGESLESLQQKCFEDLTKFTDMMYETYDIQVQELLDLVSSDKHQMKELVGIERRLSELEKRLNEAKKISRAQNDMSQGFIKHQSQLNTMDDAVALLPDLCKSHQQQLSQMLEAQQRIVALQNNFRNSKQEMSTNIHQRLGWVMHIETQIAKLDSELIFHLKTLRILEYNLDLLCQVKASPQVYAEMVVEATQRKYFSRKFSQWAEVLVEDSNQLYKAESERRRQFSKRLGEHFLLHTLFKGFEDMPPNFATKVPRSFDASLPDITEEDISMLKSTVPELEESLSVGENFTPFPLDLLSKQTRDSFEENTSFGQRKGLNSSLSQSNLQNKPCVITATEAPPTRFTLPDLQESRATEYHPALSSLSETMKDVSALEDTKESIHQLGVDFDKCVDKIDEYQDTKETQTSPGSDPQCTKCLKITSDTADIHLIKQPTSGKVASNTESSSPLSSNEFATADFYFEDSMPSPMAELSSEKKEKEAKEESSSKDNGEAVASLKDQLREKEEALGELRNLLKERETEVFKMQRQLNIESSRSDESESTTMSTVHGPMQESDQEATEGKDNSSVTKVKGNESSLELHELTSLETSVRVQNRVKDLEQKLQKLTEDLELSKDSLIKAEQNLHDVQEQEQASLQKKNKLIGQLQEEITSKNSNLENLKESLQSKEIIILDLEKNLEENQHKIEKLQGEAASADETLHKVKNRLKEFALTTKQNIPILKKDLDEMKSVVRENSSQLDAARNTALDLLQKEKEKLALEKEEMEQMLSKIQQDLSQEIKTLKASNNDLSEQLSKKEEHFAKKYAEQRFDFDSALRDMETRHALELEIELDKYKSETRESIEESERNYEAVSDMKDKLIKEVEDTKSKCEERIKELEMLHESNLLEMGKNYKLKAEESEKKFEEMLTESKKEEEKLKASLDAMDKRTKERDSEWKKEWELLLAEHVDAMNDLKETMSSQRKDMEELLEKKQLDHAIKLTSLKSDFDVEKETLLAQLRKFTDHSLTTSETQTGLELLAEVISLTSSASDGSEEMSATKSGAYSPEEKEDTGISDLAAKKTQLKQEELSAELSNALESISSLKEQLESLTNENQSLKERISDMSGQEDSMEGSQTKLRDDIEKGKPANQMEISTSTASFILMDKEQLSDQRLLEEMKLKDHKISQLEKFLMEMSVTAEKAQPSDKVSIKGCDKGDLVLLCLDERHDQYVVFTVGTNLHFLHSDSMECLGIKQDMEPSKRKSWILAEVIDKEYCLAKKPNNRFRVPQGTCFYRVKCQPWKCDFDTVKQDPVRKSSKKEPSETSSKGKK